MGHQDAKKWWAGLSNQQVKHILKTYPKPIFGFSNSEKSNLMKKYQNDPNFLSLGSQQTQQTSLQDWTKFIDNGF